MSFQCIYCDVSFKTKQHYNTHLQTKKHLKLFNIYEDKIKQFIEENKKLKEENEKLRDQILKVPESTLKSLKIQS